MTAICLAISAWSAWLIDKASSHTRWVPSLPWHPRAINFPSFEKLAMGKVRKVEQLPHAIFSIWTSPQTYDTAVYFVPHRGMTAMTTTSSPDGRVKVKLSLHSRQERKSIFAGCHVS